VLLWLYALADALDSLDDAVGVEGETPVVIASRSWAMVGGWIEKRPPIDRDSLTRQDALVRQVHARARAVLPMRFGTSVTDPDAAARALEPLDAVIRARFDVVRDREQMTLRAGASGASSASGASVASGASSASGASEEREAPGRRYLERLAAERRPVEIQPLLQALAPLERAVHIESGRQSGLVTVYHLIDRGRSAEYLESVARAVRAQPHLSIRATGPFPPYAFADLGRLR
jgi:hypothetical protein